MLVIRHGKLAPEFQENRNKLWRSKEGAISILTEEIKDLFEQQTPLRLFRVVIGSRQDAMDVMLLFFFVLRGVRQLFVGFYYTFS